MNNIVTEFLKIIPVCICICVASYMAIFSISGWVHFLLFAVLLAGITKTDWDWKGGDKE